MLLRRDDALQMMLNALDVQVMQIIGIAKSGILREGTEKETILTEYFGIYNRESVLLADSVTAVYGEKPDEGRISFAEGTYAIRNLSTKNVVGANVRYYYEYVDDEPVVIYLEKRKNTEMALSASNIVYHYEDNMYTTERNGKTVKLPLSVLIFGQLYTDIISQSVACLLALLVLFVLQTLDKNRHFKT